MRTPLSVLKGYLAFSIPNEHDGNKEFYDAAIHSVDKLLEIAEKLERFSSAT